MLVSCRGVVRCLIFGKETLVIGGVGSGKLDRKGRNQVHCRLQHDASCKNLRAKLTPASDVGGAHLILVNLALSGMVEAEDKS
jgi:hypothetical protein